MEKDYRWLVEKSENFMVGLGYVEEFKVALDNKIDDLQKQLADKTSECEKLRECLSENLEFDKSIFVKSDGLGASLSNMLRSENLLSELNRGKE